jgi:hypothetical protein
MIAQVLTNQADCINRWIKELASRLSLDSHAEPNTSEPAREHNSKRAILGIAQPGFHLLFIDT